LSAITGFVEIGASHSKTTNPIMMAAPTNRKARPQWQHQAAQTFHLQTP
jgi:hypothetical protein